MPSPDRKRLDSWKMIAEYLGRDVRTVTRWAASRGLPVHRVPGGKRQSVFAYSSEIDEWLVDERSPKPNNSESPAYTKVPTTNVGANRGSEPELRRLTGVRTFTWAALTIALLVAGAAWAISTLLAGRGRAAAAVSLDFVQLTDDGMPKSNFSLGGTKLYFNESASTGYSAFSMPAQGGTPRKIDIPVPNPQIQEISHDGRRLLITSSEGQELEHPLFVVPSNGGAVQRVGNLTCEWAAWSPHEDRIACARGTSVLIANSDGTQAQTLASLSSPPSRLSWSPNGKELIFELSNTKDPTTESAWKFDLTAGVGKRRVAPVALPWGKDCCIDWTWTADRKRFLYLQLGSDRHPVLHELRSVDSNDSHSNLGAELPVNVGEIHGLRADEERNLIYLLIDGRAQGEVLKVGSSKNSYQVILPGVSADYISYSRDGQWIAFVNAADRSLWRCRSDGTDRRQLTPPTAPAGDTELPSWSPDGLTIAYTTVVSGGPWRIFLVGRDGNNRRELIPGGENNQGAPTWSPSGGKIVYADVMCQETDTCWVHEVDIQTGKENAIPGSNGLRTARLSPDGRYIAALRPDAHELLLFNTATKTWSAIAGSVTGDNISWSRDSRYVFADSPRIEHPVIERIRVADGRRMTVADLGPIGRMPGIESGWFGIMPDGSLILTHLDMSTKIYALSWNFH